MAATNFIRCRTAVWTMLALLFVSLLLAMVEQAARADDARTIRLLRPLDGATVREIVPVRLSPADLPGDGYVTVSIDKVFRTAQLITPGSSLIYNWDTQAPYQDASDPGVDKFFEDGTHEIEIAVYDRQGTLLASGASAVRLANKVTNLPDGIKLSYNWSQSYTMRYKRHSELNVLGTGGDSSLNAETADIRFARTIEDATGGEYLVRDLVYPDGLISEHGVTAPVQSTYVLKSRYRTVNGYGDVLVEETPFSVGDHLGFPIAAVPARRITVGDSWDSKIETSVTWANVKPTVLDGSARLDSFEWQNGYPTAKIIETYDGPAQFYADARSTISFQADNVHLVRTYWFAYNSRMLVRMRTDMVIDGNVDPSVATAFGASQQTSGPQQTQPGYGGNFGNNGPGGETPFGGGNGPMGASPGGAASTTVPIKLEVTDDTTLVGI